MEGIQDIKCTYGGILFKKNNEWYCHGSNSEGIFGLGFQGPDYIPKSDPVKVPWKCDELITDGGNNIFFRLNDDWYAAGSNSCGKFGIGYNMPKYINTPIKIPLSGIKKIFSHPNKTYFCTEKECYVAGDNSDGELGIRNQEQLKVYTLTKVDWYPKNIKNENYITYIQMNDNNVYAMGLNNNCNHGLMMKIGNTIPNIINYPMKIDCCINFDEQDKDYLCCKCKFDLAKYNSNMCIDCCFENGKLSKKDKKIYNKQKLMSKDNLPKLNDLLSNKFESLKKYFKGITTQDLANFTGNDLVHYVLPEDKFLMILFVKTIISNYLLKIFLYSNKDTEFKIFSLKPTDGILDLKNKILSSKVEIYENPLSMKYLIENVQDKENIKIMDCSHNLLTNKDMVQIKQLVLKMPCLETLNLSYTHLIGSNSSNIIKRDEFYDVSDDLKEIIKMDNIKYIDIQMTSLASYDGHDFLNSLDHKLISKLIWIPSNFLNKDSWKTIINNINYINIIINTHNDYYKLYK